MERLSALINRLKERHEAGCSNEELLLLVDRLKNELTGPFNSFEHPSPVVSVMMPVGYAPIAAGTQVPGAKVNELPVNGKIEDITSTNLKEGIINGEPPSLQENTIEKKMPPLPRPAFTVLRPPTVTVIEEEVIQQIQTPVVNDEIQQQNEILAVKEEIHQQIEAPVAEEIYQLTDIPVKEEVHEPSVMDDILGFLKFPKPEKRESPLAFSEEKEETGEKPLVFELDLKAGEVHNDFQSATEGPHEKEHFEEVVILEMPREQEKPKELHEILAARVVATPSGLTEGKKMLGDTLGSTRITDLRKGIAVNDRFRYIKSLFRGDETLFERSIKTINNFNILAEAQYWIQRELVIKLGWNDEDELVQQFYSLVSRRFL